MSRLGRYGAGEVSLALDELLDIAAGPTTEEMADLSMLSAQITTLLEGLESTGRRIFVRRYFYVDPLTEIARAYGMSESGVKSQLFRTRQKLKEFLEKEGYEL